jgi:hypothetical protein
MVVWVPADTDMPVEDFEALPSVKDDSLNSSSFLEQLNFNSCRKEVATKFPHLQISK